MTMVLILAMAVSFGIDSWIEGGVVTFVILLNVVVGFFQEFSAEKTMDSLRSPSSPTASVVRDGKTMVVPSSEIIPGDLIEIKTGDTIPADVKLIEAVNFETDEALLTGESLPVRENAVFASRFGWNRLRLTTGETPEWSEIAEVPFDSDAKRMSVIMKHNPTGEYHAHTKGAVERVIQICKKSTPEDSGKLADVTPEFHEEILRNMEALAGLGLRVLALASRPFDNSTPTKGDKVERASVERDLCHEAGISVHVLTGDHPETAKAITIEVGILLSRMDCVVRNVADAMVMTASQFDALTDDEVDRLPVLPLVIARCIPSTKTGDDSGSDVAKDASDIVLTDDNFASIVTDIKEGQQIFDNIQNLTFKDARGLSIFPPTPVEIVWIIMATSGMPDMGLSFKQAIPNIMRQPPQSLKTGIFNAKFLVDMVVYGLWIMALCLSSFSLVVYSFGDERLGENCNGSHNETCDIVFRARATTFACLTLFALFLAWEMPGSKKYFTQWMIDVRRNKFLFWAIIIGFVTLFPLLYIPIINTSSPRLSSSTSRKTLGVAWKDMDIEQRVFGEYLGGPSDDDHHTEVGYYDPDMEKKEGSGK
ncbi:uncharacterized protein LY79DRAFT_707845 [Colletotrichum navitas]|uniref:Cation-transporting P-type ATPase C-terminal domain-containing protein n=1 Tax=Colletotrichum navitas TaxID=681940 RepID=A0AAD8PL24_9PEZI|nr:uncharacterized protein LY79DRAFT_707845 [Colletotrichum navitas]KAK1569660.1 hypothetical protein LY79DRAFT_707845 [Colletotrichum navitas]